MKTISLLLLGRCDLAITVADDGSANIISGLERAQCPDCGQADCCFPDQHHTADYPEDEDGVVARLKYNGFLDALESILLAHAAAGLDVQAPGYLRGLETALEAAGNNY